MLKFERKQLDNAAHEHSFLNLYKLNFGQNGINKFKLYEKIASEIATNNGLSYINLDICKEIRKKKLKKLSCTNVKSKVSQIFRSNSQSKSSNKNIIASKINKSRTNPLTFRILKTPQLKKETNLSMPSKLTGIYPKEVRELKERKKKKELLIRDLSNINLKIEAECFVANLLGVKDPYFIEEMKIQEELKAVEKKLKENDKINKNNKSYSIDTDEWDSSQIDTIVHKSSEKNKNTNNLINLVEKYNRNSKRKFTGSTVSTISKKRNISNKYLRSAIKNKDNIKNDEYKESINGYIDLKTNNLPKNKKVVKIDNNSNSLISLLKDGPKLIDHKMYHALNKEIFTNHYKQLNPMQPKQFYQRYNNSTVNRKIIDGACKRIDNRIDLTTNSVLKEKNYTDLAVSKKFIKHVKLNFNSKNYECNNLNESKINNPSIAKLDASSYVKKSIILNTCDEKTRIIKELNVLFPQNTELNKIKNENKPNRQYNEKLTSMDINKNKLIVNKITELINSTIKD